VPRRDARRGRRRWSKAVGPTVGSGSILAVAVLSNHLFPWCGRIAMHASSSRCCWWLLRRRTTMMSVHWHCNGAHLVVVLAWATCMAPGAPHEARVAQVASHYTIAVAWRCMDASRVRPSDHHTNGFDVDRAYVRVCVLCVCVTVTSPHLTCCNLVPMHAQPHLLFCGGSS
jgi:hypothetical protein